MGTGGVVTGGVVTGGVVTGEVVVQWRGGQVECDR